MKYKNFNDYAENDPDYLLRVLTGKLFDPQETIHFLDGSSYLLSSLGYRAWYLNHRIHREDGPAIEYANGRKEWWIDGRRHRVDGPAVIFSDGDRDWWLEDKIYTEKEYWSAIQDLK